MDIGEAVRTVGTVMLYATGLPAAYLIALAGAGLLPEPFSEKITTQEQLERIVAEEMLRAGCSEPVRCSSFPAKETCVEEEEDGTYRIDIRKEDASRSVVAHEVRHIAAGHSRQYDIIHAHFGEVGTTIAYFLVHEPSAVLWQYLAPFKPLSRKTKDATTTVAQKDASF